MNLDERTLRLIAVGASVSANCQPCMQASVSKARLAGLQEEDIAEAIRIGKMVRQGAASKMDKLIQDLSSVQPENVAGTACDCSSYSIKSPPDRSVF